MTPNQSHVAGLELALDLVREISRLQPGYSDEREAIFEALSDAFVQATAPPSEPVQGEAVAWKVIGVHPRHRHPHVTIENTSKLAYGQAEHWRNRGCEVEIIPLYTAAATPDAELVELLRECAESFAVWDSSPAIRLKARIDAKLATLRNN